MTQKNIEIDLVARQQRFQREALEFFRLLALGDTGDEIIEVGRTIEAPYPASADDVTAP